MATKKLTFELDLPEELLEGFDSEAEATQEAKEAFVMELLRRGAISQGKAASVLGISRWDLPQLMAEYGVPSVMVEPDELARDKEALDNALRDNA